MDRDSVQAWLDAYVDAWLTYDPKAIGDLFSEDAEYRYHPYDQDDDVVRGREAIVRSWTAPEGSESGRDAPGTYDAHYEPFAVDPTERRAVALGWSRYYTDGTQSEVERTFDNCYLLEFDGDGRCRSFTEFFMERKG